MAITNAGEASLSISNIRLGVQVTKVTDTSADWTSVANNTYFYDKADQMIHYKDTSGNIVELFTPVNDVQVFTTPGAFTWTKPAGARYVEVQIVAGGGGGGSGRKGASLSIRSGGGGGAGGGATIISVPASNFGATVSGAVGAGGNGGASQATNSTNGVIGTVGGASTFGIFRANGGGAGAAGTITTATGGTGGGGTFGGGAGGTGAGSAAGTAGASSSFTSGGGGGGGINASDVLVVASAGGFVNSTNLAQAAVNTSPTPHGLIIPVGFGAGGTSAALTGNATTGFNGGLYGGGGGGGGAATDGSGNSGAGGAGASGIVIVTTYF